MPDTRTKPDTALRDALVAVEVAQAVHNHALLRSQTRKQPITLARLYAANHALFVIQNNITNQQKVKT
jgi:ABC-type transport system involved in cytochrome c biogenesis ATPase subunit